MAMAAAAIVTAQAGPAAASGVDFAEVWGSDASGQLGLGPTVDYEQALRTGKAA